MPTWSATGPGRTGFTEDWTVPATGPYRIVAKGARGGYAYLQSSSTINPGGNGARIEADFTLTAGHTLRFMVGHMGGDNPNQSRGGGGGGATFVYNVTTSTLLMVAGGGGGAGQYTTNFKHALTTANGSAGSNQTSSANNGGTAPNGGGTNSYGGGGGGYSGNGANNANGYGYGGLSYTNGGTGGQGYADGNPTVNFDGGYGGGGGAYAGAGGGGGYGGGGSGGWSNSGDGGGGGSYYASSTNLTAVVDNTTHGQVIITALNTAPTKPTALLPSDQIIAKDDRAADEVIDFNIPDQTGLGTGWTYFTDQGQLRIINNKAAPPVSGTAVEYRTINSPDFEAKVDVTLSPVRSNWGMVYRVTGTTHASGVFFFAAVRHTNEATLPEVAIYRHNSDNTWTTLATSAWSVLGSLEGLPISVLIRAEGNSHRLYINNILAVQATDSTNNNIANWGFYSHTAATSDDGQTRWDNAAIWTPPRPIVAVSWTHNDPESSPQTKYQLRWREADPIIGAVAHLDVGALTATAGNAVTSAPAVSGYPAWTAQNGGPIYRTGGQGGQPYLEHSSSGTGLRWSGNLTLGDSTIFIVANQRGTANYRILSSISNNWLLGWHGGFEDRHYAEGWVFEPPGTTATTNVRIYAARRFGAYSTFWRGTNQLAHSNTTGTAGPEGLTTNGYQGTSEFSDSNVYEVIVYSRALTSVEVDQKMTELLTKYGLV